MFAFFLYLFFTLMTQGGSKSSIGVASYPWVDVAVWHLGALLDCHGLHLHHPQLAAGTHQHTRKHVIFQFENSVILHCN